MASLSGSITPMIFAFKLLQANVLVNRGIDAGPKSWEKLKPWAEIESAWAELESDFAGSLAELSPERFANWEFAISVSCKQDFYMYYCEQTRLAHSIGKTLPPIPDWIQEFVFGRRNVC
ncbi:hypothetical protein FRC12_012937 [Ceratobasidium sp. 428]|nr:hypothetical protein FRC12_012937 [Ceratobasidium sp. 428]